MSFLNLEPHLVDRLGQVDGLVVKTTTNTSEATLGALGTRPTAIVAFIAADVADSRAKALLSVQRWSVYYVRRGALSERDPVDGEHLERVIKLLHGWTPDEEAFSPLKLENVNTDYRDNAREYFLTFVSQVAMAL